MRKYILHEKLHFLKFESTKLDKYFFSSFSIEIFLKVSEKSSKILTVTPEWSPNSKL